MTVSKRPLVGGRTVHWSLNSLCAANPSRIPFGKSHRCWASSIQATPGRFTRRDPGTAIKMLTGTAIKMLTNNLRKKFKPQAWNSSPSLDQRLTKTQPIVLQMMRRISSWGILWFSCFQTLSIFFISFLGIFCCFLTLSTLRDLRWHLMKNHGHSIWEVFRNRIS